MNSTQGPSTDIEAGQLKEPEHEIVTLTAEEPDEEASRKVKDAIAKMAEGQYGKKVLLRLEGE